MAEFKITIEDMSGFQVSGAKSRVLLPDDSYRKWWETQNN